MGGLSKHAAHLFKRAQRGLFAGRMITFGNRVSDCGGNEYKSRRTWKPNVVNKKLYSEILDKVIPLKVTTHALRCIDNKGGLDNYLLKTKDEDIASIRGLELKKQVQEILKKFPDGFPDRKAPQAPKVEDLP